MCGCFIIIGESAFQAFSRVRFAQSFAFSVVFCRPLFVLLVRFGIVCLSFNLLLIITLVSSNFSYCLNISYSNLEKSLKNLPNKSENK